MEGRKGHDAEESSPPAYFLAKLANHTGFTHDNLAGFHRSFTHALSSKRPGGHSEVVDGKIDVVQFKEALHEALGNDKSVKSIQSTLYVTGVKRMLLFL
jgi:hypothetical protein